MRIKIHIIQYEHGGIPEEPVLFLNAGDAEEYFEELVVEQGFRKRIAGEMFFDYEAAYNSALADDSDHDSVEELPDPDDTVRYWIKAITL